MPKLTIQIREEGKFFTKGELSECLGVSKETLTKWITKQIIFKPPTKKGYSKEDIKRIFKMIGYNTSVPLGNEAKLQWDDLLLSKLVFKDGGVFVVDPTVNDFAQAIREMTGRYEIWRAQGINNHEHLKDYIENPIFQVFLAEELIATYKEKLQDVRVDGKIVVYWNGKKDSTICIYQYSISDDGFLNKYDLELGMKNTIVTEVSLS